MRPKKALVSRRSPAGPTSARELGASRRRYHYRIAACVIPCGGGTSGDALVSVGDLAHAPNMNVQDASRVTPVIPMPVRRVIRSLRMALRASFQVPIVVAFHVRTRSRGLQISISVGVDHPMAQFLIVAGILRWVSFNQVS